MDEPGDTCWTWPFWKFGLKKDDLFGTLHERYNTFASPILDPEAFHHDVYEIAQQASNTDEFHRLLNARKEQRLRELNETLESAAFEIIANPSLINTEQWQHAVQLFRTKSLDSLVRYYASYLPSDHPWYKSTKSSSQSETDSSVDSLTDSHGTFEDEEIPFMDEPLEYPSYSKQLLPPSPRSMTVCSDSSVASPADDGHEFDFERPAPSRALSFSDSEPDCCSVSGTDECCSRNQEPDCQAGSGEISTTTTSGVESDINTEPNTESAKGEATLPVMSPNIIDSETPTPRPDTHAASFFCDTKPSPSRQSRHRSLSPSRPHPLTLREVDEVLAAHRDPRNPQRLRLNRKERECSPGAQRRRRGSPVESVTRIQKSLPESGRCRFRGRKLAERR
ncbi:hypothetical protein VTH82DRAFT_6092 [Thermothelomyces myriococcoides]